MKRNTIIEIAMVAVAIVAIVVIIVVAVTSPAEDVAPEMIGDVNITTAVTNKKHVSIPENLEPATKVLMLDRSVSMQNYLSAMSNYDTCIEFSEYFGDTGANSLILTNLKRVLDLGVQEIGIISDLESYPESDLLAFSGLKEKYSNRRLEFFTPYGVDFRLYETILRSVLDETCTLIFNNGDQKIVMNNYIGPEKKVLETDIEIESVIPQVKDNHKLVTGNYVPPSQLRNLWLAFITTFAVLAEVILYILLHCFCSEPEWMNTVLATGNIALDGSASVYHSYESMLQYLRRYRRLITTIWRFASNIQVMSWEEARNYCPEGQTHGWECLNVIYQAGIRELTVLSDLNFTDEYNYDIHFRRIVVIIPSGMGNSATLERLREISDDLRVYYYS